MSFKTLKQIMENEKSNLFKATEFLIDFYNQIFDSIINLRDNVFTNAFSSVSDWKVQLREEVKELNFPDYNLLSIEGEIQNNSDHIIIILNNVRYIKNNYLKNPEKITFKALEQIIQVNNQLLNFIQNLYTRDNLNLLPTQRLNMAKAIRNNITRIFNENIIPFFKGLQDIFIDEYRLKLRPELKQIVVNQSNYTEDSHKYDNDIKEKCNELGIEYNHDIVLNSIADLSKDDDTIINEIKNKYTVEQNQEKTGKILRLKEIALRGIGQLKNISRLEVFLKLIYKIFQPLTFFQKLLDILKKFLTGKGIDFPKKDLYFHFSPRSGRLEQKRTSVTILIKDIAALKGFLAKVKSTIEFYNYTKRMGSVTARELENIIENSLASLSSIYTQCLGLRDFLIWKKNYNYLKKISLRWQEEFNELLLDINYHLILSKQHLRDLKLKYYKEDTEVTDVLDPGQ